MSLLNRELDYFLTICETRNLARAAEVLGVTQPALTRSVQRLETHVGAQLFVRAPRGVELTAIGVALRRRAEKARVTLSDAESEVAQLAAGKIGKVRIGAGHILARLVTHSLFPRFIVERPAAQVQLHVAFNAELFELVEAGNLDFAVCGLIETPPNLAFRELLTTDLVIIVRAGHPLTKIRKPKLHDLAEYRSAAPSVGVPGRQVVERILANVGLGGRPHAIETNSWDAILEAVATSDLFSLAPRNEALRHAWSPELTAVAIPEIEVRSRTGVLTRAEAYVSPLAARAIELVAAGFADRADEGGARAPRRAVLVR